MTEESVATTSVYTNSNDEETDSPIKGDFTTTASNLKAIDLSHRMEDFNAARTLRAEESKASSRWCCNYIPTASFVFEEGIGNMATDLSWSKEAERRRNENLPFVSWGDFCISHTAEALSTFSRIVIVICILWFVVAIGFNNWELVNRGGLLHDWTLDSSSNRLLQWCALDKTSVMDKFEWYRLWVSIFCHSGIFRLVFNMACFWMYGWRVERRLGSKVASSYCLLTAIGGNILSCLCRPTDASVLQGTTGAIAGMIGFVYADIFTNWNVLTNKTYKGSSLCSSLAIEVFLIGMVLGLVPVVDLFVFVGGLAYGFCFAYPLIEIDDEIILALFHHRQCPKRLFGFFRGLIFVLSIVGYCKSVVLLFDKSGGNL